MAAEIPESPDMTLPPSLEECAFRDLYEKETYEFDTADGWRLVITRYQSRPQPWRQPFRGVPALLVHGFSQNRHAWTAGDFVKRLVYRGLDVHILELRGHGKSHLELQEDAALRFERGVPKDWDYGWDFSDYFLTDVPTAIEAVKAKTGTTELLYIGHSMGGIIGYGMASTRDDLLGLMTLGSPLDLASESLLLRAVAQLEPLTPVLKWVGHTVGVGIESIRALVPGQEASSLHVNAVPMDVLLGRLYRSLALAEAGSPRKLPRGIRLFSPGRARPEHVRWLLERGEDKEPYRVLRTFARWIRRRELKCPRSLFDFRDAVRRIEIPMVVICGSHDILAGEESTRMAFDRASSDYLIWRRLDGDGHIDLTVGDCTEEIARELDGLLAHATGPVRP